MVTRIRRCVVQCWSSQPEARLTAEALLDAVTDTLVELPIDVPKQMVAEVRRLKSIQLEAKEEWEIGKAEVILHAELGAGSFGAGTPRNRSASRMNLAHSPPPARAVFAGTWRSTAVAVKRLVLKDEDSDDIQNDFLREVGIWYAPHSLFPLQQCQIYDRSFRVHLNHPVPSLHAR